MNGYDAGIWRIPSNCVVVGDPSRPAPTEVTTPRAPPLCSGCSHPPPWRRASLRGSSSDAYGCGEELSRSRLFTKLPQNPLALSAIESSLHRRELGHLPISNVFLGFSSPPARHRSTKGRVRPP